MFAVVVATPPAVFAAATDSATMANGARVEFSDKGVWEEVDCQFSEVPSEIIPVAIKKYIDENFAGEKVISIERNRYNYEVILSNRLELKFDKDFNIYDIDD